jgi:hypothetical protein
MDSGKTSLERAFELAASGKFHNIEKLKRDLRHEGYSSASVKGQALRKQLLDLMKAKPDS